ncbi:arylamine N-acetyltransferase family protein [Photobacterium leiognathi]|uniref:arylamine N-acetyltransferase family protein n=1 Tax=Photobacterium leiognathi TaxID=553611 RepID=UPI002738C1CF|nr:arylamine N-acetyltransferase [Photobacterium leiognathi]
MCPEFKFEITKYLRRIGIDKCIGNDFESVKRLHSSHFYNVPFENLEMVSNKNNKIDIKNVYERIVEKRKGGICFEFCLLIEEVFKNIGINYSSQLARIHQPFITGCTHQFFIISIDDDEFIFDVGFGAKGPRGLLKLENGYVLEDNFNSSKVIYDEEIGWCIFSLEKCSNDWELIYSFTKNKITREDIEIAYFYVKNSPDSLLNKNKVVSIPLSNGRKSFKNDIITIVVDEEVEVVKVDNDIINTINREFKLDVCL